MTPIATTVLTNGTGTLRLPAPRGAYDLRLDRTSPTTATLEARGTFPGRCELLYFAPHLDADLNPVEGFFHGHIEIDRYVWRVWADPALREVRVFDDVRQPYRGRLAEIDERGRVAV